MSTNEFVRPGDERDHEIRGLQKDLKKYYDRSEHYQQLCQELENSNRAVQQVVKRQELDISNLRQTADENTFGVTDSGESAKLEITRLTEIKEQQLLDIAQLTKIAAAQRRNITELTKTTAEQRLSISGLMETIARSLYGVQGINTVTRDDDYFDTEFACLAGDIRQWAFRYFRGGPDVQYQDLSPTVQQCMRGAVRRYDAVPGTKISAREIEATITQRLSQLIFNRSFVFAVHGLKYPSVFEFIGGTGWPEREKRELHARTVNMLMKNPCFSASLNDRVLLVANEIRSCFDSLAKSGTEERRYRALQNIVERAAELWLDTYRQVSRFELRPIDPGSEYIPWLMEDRSGTVDEDEEEGNSTHHSVVQMVFFPTVLRWGFDEAGMFSESPIVVRKAAVMATPPETGAET